MRNTWYLVITCDACGQTQKTDAWSSDSSAAWNQPSPAGWYGGDTLSWGLRDPFGLAIRDLCPSCLQLPFLELIERITQRSKESAGGNRD